LTEKYISPVHLGCIQFVEDERDTDRVLGWVVPYASRLKISGAENKHGWKRHRQSVRNL